MDSPCINEGCFVISVERGGEHFSLARRGRVLIYSDGFWPMNSL